MRKHPIFCAIPLLMLAACHANVDVGDGNAEAGNVHVAVAEAGEGSNKVSVNVPGFNANVSLPNLNLGSHIDLDGIKMAPNSKVGSFDVNARDDGDGADKDEGTVRLGFTNPGAPAALIDHYARSAADAGYGNITRTATSMSATKTGKSFTVEIAPEGSGSRGTITIAGKG
ncbi:MAG TPA: hypothetical protein VNT42_11115 [Sphingomonas sp.]|nr:hypothetical protein [Sphingomonas sp.]